MDGYGRGGGGAGGGRGRGGGGRGRGRGGGDGRGGGYQHRPQRHQQQFQHQNDQYRDRQAGHELRGSSSSQTETCAPPSEEGSGWKQVGSARSAPSDAWKTGAWGTGAVEGGGDRGQQVSVQSSPTPSSEPDHDSVIPEMRSLEISKQSALDNNNKVPMKRPDTGDTSSFRSVGLIVNHFPVKFNPERTIWHYDVDVKPVGSSSGGRAPKITKSNLCMIRTELFSDGSAEFPFSMTAYDGEKNIFSAVPLPTGEFPLDLSEGEGTRIRSFTFSIKLVNELKLCKLTKYLPRDILQMMDVVMKENPSRRLITIGRSFYPTEFSPQDDLGFGIAASRGFQQSLKPTSQGLSLCLDSSVLAFRKRIPVLEFLQEHIGGFNINNFRKFRRQAESTLKRLKVTVTHCITKQKFTISGLTDRDTRNLSFTEVDPEGMAPPKQVGIVEYFEKKYGKNIMYQDIPCLDLGKNGKANHVPMEFCVLLEGQKYPKEDLERLDKRAAMFLKEISQPSPMERMNRINNMVRAEYGPCGVGIANNFGIEVDTNMTKVEARVIGPPELRVGANKKISVDEEKCQWNLVGTSVVEGIPIERWAVIDFSAYEEREQLDANNFIPKLIARCNSLGIRMGEPFKYEPACGMDSFSNVSMLHECLEYVAGEASKQGKGSLQIIVCMMSRKDPGYKFLKWISETKYGIVTKCCLSTHARKAQEDQYLANLALKINAKLGGSNVELSDQLPYFEEKFGTSVVEGKPIERWAVIDFSAYEERDQLDANTFLSVRGGIANNFGIEVDTNMTKVEARVIGPPELRQGANRKFSVDREKCQWNFVGKSVVVGKPIERWAVIDFSANERFNRLDPNNFIPKLIARCNNLGIRMGEPLIYEPCGMNLFSNASMLQECLEYVVGEASKQGKGSLQIIVCVMSRKDPGYKFLKWISETKVGIVTQCCLSTHASKAQDQYLANLALKINAKLGGSNVELSDRFPYFEGKDHVMFIGADVNHPGSGNKTSPSIAAVVGTVNWPAANRYAARIRAQCHRKEKIIDFGEICLELIENYARLNKVRPQKIVIFRVGVSEGQFNMVLNEELIDLQTVLNSKNYYPTITLIVARKRHQTRLFPETPRDGCSTGNVSPGTVVDTTIVHPIEFDFFLCSHYGSLGTSKPTRYHVLWDDHRFTSDQLQKLIYYLCSVH